MSDAPAPTRAEEGREIIAELERELGVTGTANVFRKALAIAKEAAAIARVRQETYAADQLVERLRSWGENDADPDFFTGVLLSGVLMDCGMGSEAIVAANLRAAQAEAEVARLTQERDEALCLAEGPSTLLDLARGSISRGMELHAAEAEVARLTAENERLRASLANSGGPCPYCTLPKEEWAKCASGFPGCARADDAMLCPNVGAWLNRQERIDALEAALQPFADYATDMPGADFGEGEIGEYYHDGFRRSICTQDLRAARAALEALHADEPGGVDA